jgi:hypothetical protein
LGPIRALILPCGIRSHPSSITAGALGSYRTLNTGFAKHFAQ